MLSEHRYQRRHRRGTLAGRLVAYLPFRFWLRLMLLAVARRNPYAFDNHLRPQADFVPQGARVFRLEDGVDPAVDWLAATTRQARLSAPRRLLRTWPGQAVDPETLALIARTFAMDYARFGYLPPPLPPRRPDPLGVLARLAAPLVAGLERRGLL